MPVPNEIESVLTLIDLLEMDFILAREIQGQGPQITESLAAAKSFLSQNPDENINERQIAGALLFMVLMPASQHYSPALFVSATHGYIERSFDWQTVVHELDFQPFEISRDQFLAIFNALLPIAQDTPKFDIQGLWGGQWRNAKTQLSFIKCFLSFSPSELDVTSIPGLRQAYDPREAMDGSQDIVKDVELALQDPMISLDAVTALLQICSSQQDENLVADAIKHKEWLFLCACGGVKPMTEVQDYIMKALFPLWLSGEQPERHYVLRTLWTQDKNWVANTLINLHSKDPLALTVIMDRVREQGWLDEFLVLTKGFGIDMAALAHRNGELDLEEWAEEKIDDNFIAALCKFLQLKQEDELRTARGDQPAPRTVSLSMKTVHVILAILDRRLSDRNELKKIQRQCLQAFPRLIIYCEGISDTVDVDCSSGNGLPPVVDEEMQDLYKRMYAQELQVEDILKRLEEWRSSKDANRLDVFACMIHGLFDEFSCFGEYPLIPLATTAVLFGGIIAWGLISDLTLRVGQEMILDAVSDNTPDASMYKFGLQALLQIRDCLRQPGWTEYCARLVEIPGLRGTEPYLIAQEVVAEDQSLHGDGRSNGLLGGAKIPNGDMEDFISPDTALVFKSMNAEPATAYDEPDDKLQDKVVFFFNNVSEQNLPSKFNELKDALDEKYHQWFASFLVEGRAKVEPNYQPLYINILNLLGSKSLWEEVLRETFVSVHRILNAESTMQSASERKKMKNLATWLGSLTLSRDKPIKFKNISFLDLLIEGLETQRLLLVIPFTCSVLAQGIRSVIFKPPNPWVDEIFAALVELYTHFDIATNQKFDIEVLLGDFGLAPKYIEPSEVIRRRPLLDEDMPNGVLPDGLEGFDDMTLGNMNRIVRNPRFDADSMSAALPNLENVLSFPPATGSTASQARLRQIVHDAIKRAILEIIAPVVERSVTIATIATSALIHKDFARELDEDRVRKSAQQMVRQLSGSLALVTCKEPLKMSMNNYIRIAQQEMGEEFPEGAILMCVNDNLDTACSIVEQQAEERSMPEIEQHIEGEIIQRRRHRTEHPNEPYMDAAFNRWAGFIPDPFKQLPDGLTSEQVAIYLDFARQSRVAPSHGQTGSADSGRQQLPDVLQDTFVSVSNVHTPAETLTLPQHPARQQQQQDRMLPPPLPAPVPQGQMNGYMNPGLLHDRIQGILAEISRVARDNLGKDSDSLQRVDSLWELLDQIWDILDSSPDALAMNCAEDICKGLYGETIPPLETEVKAALLGRLCAGFPNIRKEVAMWASSQDAQKIFRTDVTVPLIRCHVLQLKQIDSMLAQLLYDHMEVALDFMSLMMDALLLNDHPTALRADFANSLSALGGWLVEDSELASAQNLAKKLKEWGVDEVEDQPNEQGLLLRIQMQYIFEEWTTICDANPTNPELNVFPAFISQLHRKQLLNSQEDMAVFLRMCLEDSVDTFVLSNPEGADATSKLDWLARLIVLLVKNQGESRDAVRLDKAAYMDSILSIIVLIINQHHVAYGERFHQRAFFRLLSSVLCEWHDLGRRNNTQDRQMLLVFAKSFLMLQPRQFPGFIYSWLQLISHRYFMPSLLKLSSIEVGHFVDGKVISLTLRKGCEPFAKILEAALSYVGSQLEPSMISPLGKDLYRGLLRILLILHHDFPEFLAENHFRLCNAIPRHCTQLLNLVLSAYPSSFLELPNPFVAGLKLDRLQEMREGPRIVSDYITFLLPNNIKNMVESSVRTNHVSHDTIAQIVGEAHISDESGQAVNRSLLHALVLYLGQTAMDAGGQKGSQAFTSNSPQALLMVKLARELDAEARYYLISAMAHQLRYPNSHTQYFAYALLHIFSQEQADQQESDVRQQISRVLLERLHVIKPHPWGLVITMLELMKNSEYAFFQLSFVKSAHPVGRLSTAARVKGSHSYVLQIRAMCEDLLQSAQERERLGELAM